MMQSSKQKKYRFLPSIEKKVVKKEPFVSCSVSLLPSEPDSSHILEKLRQKNLINISRNRVTTQQTEVSKRRKQINQFNAKKFRKQIESSLLRLNKKRKEQKKLMNQRYHSQESQNKQFSNRQLIHRKNNRSLEPSKNSNKQNKKTIQKKPPLCSYEFYPQVYQIITKRRQKSADLHIQKSIAFKSTEKDVTCSKNKRKIQQLNQQLKKVLKRQNPKKPTKIIRNQLLSEGNFKNLQNYQQWRKLSIDIHQNSQKCQYQESSFEMQRERLSKIVNRNESSLKRYYDSKKYLMRINKIKNKVVAFRNQN